MSPRNDEQTENLARQLDLDIYEVGICHACLSFVSFAIDRGDEAEIRRWTRTMSPDLWEDGLALPLQAALERARRRGIAGAPEAIEEVRQRGPRARVVHAVVRHLAADLLRRSREDRARRGFPLDDGAPVLELRPPRGPPRA